MPTNETKPLTAEERNDAVLLGTQRDASHEARAEVVYRLAASDRANAAALAELRHDIGECGDECERDHEPRESGGVACPAGCTSTMVADYVEEHLEQCPAVQKRLTAERDAAHAKLARVRAWRADARRRWEGDGAMPRQATRLVLDELLVILDDEPQAPR